MTGPSTRALSHAQVQRVRDRMKAIKEIEGSQTAAARKLKISQQVYSRVLSGEAVGLFVARKVADYDKIPVAQLLEGAPLALENVLRSHPKRWSEPTIAWARRAAATDIAHPDDKSEAEWETLLDKAEAALRPIVRDVRRSR